MIIKVLLDTWRCLAWISGKTLKIKDALKNNPELSIYEAVKLFDLSRSAFYKYRETIFPVDEKC